MSLDKKDVRFKLTPDMHQALSVLAEIADADIGEFVEIIVQREIVSRIHAATVIHERTSRLGIVGNLRETAGSNGSGRA